MHFSDLFWTMFYRLKRTPCQCWQRQITFSNYSYRIKVHFTMCNWQMTHFIIQMTSDSTCGYVGFSLIIVPNKRPSRFYFLMLHFTKQPNSSKYIFYWTNLINRRFLFCYLLMLYFTRQTNNNKYIFYRTLKFLT